MFLQSTLQNIGTHLGQNIGSLKHTQVAVETASFFQEGLSSNKPKSICRTNKNNSLVCIHVFMKGCNNQLQIFIIRLTP